jgi:hypothetical protein
MAHQSFASCIQACYESATACNHCATSCLQEQDVKMLARCIALDIDCADACLMASAAMSRASESARAFCSFCAQICDLCAEECDRHQHMQHCRECAQACRRCAQECRKMVGAS